MGCTYICISIVTSYRGESSSLWIEMVASVSYLSTLREVIKFYLRASCNPRARLLCTGRFTSRQHRARVPPRLQTHVLSRVFCCLA